MAGRLRRDHDHVVILGRRDPAEVDVEPVGEEHGRARGEVRRDVRIPHALLDMVGHEHGDDLRTADRVRDRRDLGARFFCRGSGRASFAQPHDDLDAGVAEVQCVRVTLAAEADDGDLAVEQSELAVAMNRCHVMGSFTRVRERGSRP